MHSPIRREDLIRRGQLITAGEQEDPMAIQERAWGVTDNRAVSKGGDHTKADDSVDDYVVSPVVGGISTGLELIGSAFGLFDETEEPPPPASSVTCPPAVVAAS